MITTPVQRFLTLIAITTLLTGVNACTPHLSQQQCMSMNWYQIGLNDGQLGRYKRDLSKDISDCAKFNIQVKVNHYNKGYRAGTRLFCRPAKGFRLGVNGQTYNPICPPDLAGPFKRQWRRGLRRYCTANTGYNLGRSGAAYPNFCAPNQVVAFRNAYESGHRIYANIQGVQKQINDVNHQAGKLNGKIKKEEHKRDKLNAQLASNKSHLKPAQRRAIRHEIRFLNTSIFQQRTEIAQLKRQQNRLQRQMNEIKAT